MNEDLLIECCQCGKWVEKGGHMCVSEDDSGRQYSEEHLAECALCGANHEPHCQKVAGDWLDAGDVLRRTL